MFSGMDATNPASCLVRSPVGSTVYSLARYIDPAVVSFPRMFCLLRWKYTLTLAVVDSPPFGAGTTISDAFIHAGLFSGVAVFCKNRMSVTTSVPALPLKAVFGRRTAAIRLARLAIHSRVFGLIASMKLCDTITGTMPPSRTLSIIRAMK